jgi:hypothetical protein
MDDNIIDSGAISAHPPKKKTGNKPKQLKAATYEGIEVGRGENKKIIDPKEVEKLASIGMKNSEIAEWFGIDDSTLNYNFKQNILKGKLQLNQSLRRAQISLALSGNATMLIWLGKQYLSQSENPTVTDSDKILPWND